MRRGRALPALAWLALILPTGALADEFLENLHRADARSEPAERVEYYSRAIRAWRTGNRSSLLAHCHFRRGETLLFLAEFPQAEADLTKALELDPGNARAYLLRGRLRLRLGRLTPAERDLREYASMKPEDGEGRLRLGEVRERGGKPSEGLRHYERAKGLSPEDFRPPLALARVKAAQQDWAASERWLDHAEKLSGGTEGGVWTQRGRAFKGRLEPAKALEAFGRGISLQEESLLELQRSAGRRLELLELREELGASYFDRGDVFEGLGRRAEAIADYRQACGFEVREACARAESLSRKTEVKPTPPAPKEPAAVKPKKRKRRRPAPNSDPGERIYGL